MGTAVKPNILIVDDDDTNLHLLVNILKILDVNLILAQSGTEALLKIKDQEIAMALLDIRMFGMDGMELATLIQNDKSRDIIPIIFITGQLKVENELERCYEAGAVDFILKPIRKNILLSKVKIFLELYRQKQAILEDHLELEKSANELVRLNNLLVESEKMYRTLLNASPEGIFIMNMKGVITEISDITHEIFGTENKNEFIGAHFINFVPQEELKKFRDVLNKTQIEGLVQNVEIFLTRKNHSRLICELSTTLIQEANGEPKAYMAIIRDISQRKKIEQQLIRSERMVSLGEMASAMAHEINQPLLSISLGIDNLCHKIGKVSALNEPYFRDKSEKIYQDVSRIGRIIDHVRAFSRDQEEFTSAYFDLNESITNAISMISEQFKNHHISISVKLDKKIQPILGNTYRFEQVILNLLTNAKDALEEKMKRSKFDFEKTIVIRTYLNDQIINIEVKDNGCGIESDKIDRIMLPFFTTKETGKGTGIGLSISFGIIKEMNGTFDVESNPLIGSTFRIMLPTSDINE